MSCQIIVFFLDQLRNFFKYKERPRFHRDSIALFIAERLRTPPLRVCERRLREQESLVVSVSEVPEKNTATKRFTCTISELREIAHVVSTDESREILS